eukprot:403368016
MTNYIFFYGEYGLLVQACAHIGMLISRIITPRIVIKVGPRVSMIFGAVLALGYLFFQLIFLRKVWHNQQRQDDVYQYDKQIGRLFGLAISFGMGTHMATESSNIYSRYQADHIADEKQRLKKMLKFDKLNVFLIMFMILVGYLVGGAWLHKGYFQYDVDSIQIYTQRLVISCTAFVMGALAIVLVTNTSIKSPITEPIFNDRLNLINNSKNSTQKTRESYQNVLDMKTKACPYFIQIFGNIFSFRMLKYLIHILCSASIFVMFESLAFTFMYTKVRDNVVKYDVFITFWLYLTFSGVNFLFSLCTCRKLYDYNNLGTYYSGEGRKCGAFINLVVFAGLAVIVVIFKLKTWDFYDISGELTIWIFIIGGCYAGLIHLLLQKQRRSLIIVRIQDQHFYRATQIVEEFVMAALQIGLFFWFKIWTGTYYFEDILGLQFAVLLLIPTVFGLLIQIPIICCYRKSYW